MLLLDLWHIQTFVLLSGQNLVLIKMIPFSCDMQLESHLHVLNIIFREYQLWITKILKGITIKGRRDYRMAPKWTISRRRYRHFNVTNGR